MKPKRHIAHSHEDQKPGRLPEIRAAGHSVTFLFTLGDVNGGSAGLCLRFDDKGELWLSIPACRAQADTSADSEGPA
jgi:hypothetical protein